MTRVVNTILRPQPAQLAIRYGNIVRIMLPPTSVELDLGIEELVRPGTSPVGIEVDISRQITAEKPRINLEFAGLTREVMELILGRFFTLRDQFETQYVKNRFLQNAIPAAAAADPITGTPPGEGFGITLDVPSEASKFVGGRSVSLTQVDVADFDATDPDTFAVAANGEVSFSSNLVGVEKSIVIPYTLEDVEALSETEVTNVSMILSFLDSENFVFRLSVEGGQFVRDGKSIDFSAETQALEYAVQFDGTGCQPYQLVYTGQRVIC